MVTSPQGKWNVCVSGLQRSAKALSRGASITGRPVREEASRPGEGTAHTAHPIIVGSGYVHEGAATPIFGKSYTLEQKNTNLNENV